MAPRRAPAPAPAPTPTPLPAQPAASRTVRSTRRARAAVSALDDDDDDNDNDNDNDESDDDSTSIASSPAHAFARSSAAAPVRSSFRSSSRRSATPSDDGTAVDDGQEASHSHDASAHDEQDEDENAERPRSDRASLAALPRSRPSRSSRASAASTADESAASMTTAASRASGRSSRSGTTAAPPATTARPPRVSLAPVTAPTQAVLPAGSAAPPSGPKKRFVIHKMVLVDFKSYAGRQTIGPFHKSFSAVVGPNGSGKSNVIDALLFVFGWRANKMRQGKLSELIHHSAAHEDLPQCSVEIWFREIEDLPGPDAYRVVPNSRLVVARTAFRNNTSVYTVNGCKSTFGEVGALLRSHGIDLDHKRFLILQGEVESIAQMPPKGKTEHEEGLLEYLEDIIGTSDFNKPIEEAAAKVDLANEQRSLKLDRLKYVQKEKQALEHKKEEAEAYLRDQNELTQRKSTLWQIYMMECRQQMEIASEAIAQLGATLEAEREQCADTVGSSEKLAAELEEATRLYEAAKKEADRVGKELAACERRSLQVDESRKHLESKSRKLEKQLGEQRKLLSDARQTSDDSSAASDKLHGELAELEASLEREEAELERIRDSLKDKTQVFAAQIEAKQRELQPWSDKIMHKENEHKLALEEKALLSSRVEQAEEQCTVAAQAVDEIDADTETKQEDLASLERERDEIGDRIAQSERQVSAMLKSEAKLRAAADVARGKADEARASSSSNQTRSTVLNSLNRQAELGLIKGYHGRLGSLGTIDPEYDVAISTACPGLEFIVVDDVDAGQACIEHLRQHNLGRANFILLATVSRGAAPSVRTPENAPRLFDLVRPAHPKYAAAFYHQLRDTLVAQDLAHANRIAYGAQRWRVVTLDGQLIEKSGAMSGGGTRVARGAMSATPVSNMSPEQLARLEKEAQLASEELRSHRSAVAHVRDSLERMQSRKPDIEVDLDKVQMALSVAKQRRKAAVERLESIKREILPNEEEAARIAELDRLMGKIERDLDKLRAASSGIEEAITELEDQIMKVGGIELRAQKAKVEGIKEMMELNNERTVKADVARGRADMDCERAISTIADIEAQLKLLQQELGTVAETASERRALTAEVEDRAQAAREEMEDHEAAREQLAEQLEEYSGAMNRFRRLELETKQKVEDNQRSLTDNKKRLAHWTERIGKLQLHLLLEEEDTEDDGETKLQLPMYPVEEVREFDKEGLLAEIPIFEERLSKGTANLTVIEEYRKREQDFLEHARALEATTAERDAAKQQYETLRKERFDKFMASFSVISAKLKEMYQTITLGGNAELELVDSLDPFSEGIIFSVMPPKKSWRNISNLSGGEKTLSSLALVFALHAYKPTPLYVMDEIDAALDFRNVSIVANLIKERTKGAQFVIISLRNNMFELAARLVGIYKTSGMTKSLTIENKDLRLAGEDDGKKPVISQDRHAPPVPRSSILSARASVARPSAVASRLGRPDAVAPSS